MGLQNKLNNFELNLIPFYFLNHFSNKSKDKQGDQDVFIQLLYNKLCSGNAQGTNVKNGLFLLLKVNK